MQIRNLRPERPLLTGLYSKTGGKMVRYTNEIIYDTHVARNLHTYRTSNEHIDSNTLSKLCPILYSPVKQI